MSRRVERTDWGYGVRQKGFMLKRQAEISGPEDFELLTPIAKQDELWQESVLVALTKLRPARASTAKWLRHATAALLELTF